MEADELGAADGQVRTDHMWARQLQRLIDSTPLAATALEALRPLAAFADFSIEWDDLKFVVEGQEHPRPDAHGPERYFAPGTKLTWYEFKSSSQKTEVMSRPQVGRLPPRSFGCLCAYTYSAACARTPTHMKQG